MTKKLSKDGWAGIASGIIMLAVGLLGSFSVNLRLIIIGAGAAVIVISAAYLNEDVAEPNEGLEIEKKVE